MSGDIDERVQAMPHEDRRSLATALLYICLSDSAGLPNGRESQLLRRAMATMKQIKSGQPQPQTQPQNPT